MRIRGWQSAGYPKNGTGGVFGRSWKHETADGAWFVIIPVAYESRTNAILAAIEGGVQTLPPRNVEH